MHLSVFYVIYTEFVYEVNGLISQCCFGMGKGCFVTLDVGLCSELRKYAENRRKDVRIAVCEIKLTAAIYSSDVC